MEESSRIVMDLSDDDEEVIRTIELQKSLISESQTLINTQVTVIGCDSLPQSSGENNLSAEDASAAAPNEEISYRNALAANLEYDNYLARLESNLKTLIAECKSNLDDLAIVREGNKGTKKRSSLRGRGNHVYPFGAPFFKDKDYYPCPPNADAVSKTQNNELCMVDLPLLRWWNPSHTKQLIDAIKTQATQVCKMDAMSEKQALQRRLNALEESSDERKTLEEEIKNFNIDDHISSHLNEKIATMDHDWLKLSASVLKGKHTAEECRGFWYNFLHPKFYKGKWSKEEDAKLRSLADENNCQNWELIAEQLGTGRSGYQCFAQYQSETVELSKQKWTDSEDEHLRAIVDKFRVGDYIPWGQVTIHMKGRTKTQVYNRWTYSLNPIIKKGRFTIQEDITILRGVQKWGQDFQRISSYMPDRTAPQIRIRYLSGICKSDFQPWTKEEDKVLLELVEKYGRNWTQLSKHLTGKSAHKIRHRFETISKWLHANPGKPLKEISSRRNSKSDIYNAYPEMWSYADKLLSGGNPKCASTSLLIPSANLQKPKRYTNRSSLIDEKLAEYFQGTYSKFTTARKFTSLPECSPSLISDVASFLGLLGAKLNIPNDEYLDNDESLDQEDRQVLKGLRSAHWNVLETDQHDFEHVNVDDVNRAGTTIAKYVNIGYAQTSVNIDYVQPSDPTSTQLSLPYSFTGPFPISWCNPVALTPEPAPPTVEEAHPLFGHLKYLCPPNYSTLVGLRSILLGKRKLVESISEYATDPILSDVDDKKSEAFSRARQLWDDRLMSLFALANMVSKIKPPKTEIVEDDGAQPGTSGLPPPRGLPPLRGVSPDSDSEDQPIPGTSDALHVDRTLLSEDGTVHVLCHRTNGKKRGQRGRTKWGPPKKRPKKS